jgi:hypothetical protein
MDDFFPLYMKNRVMKWLVLLIEYRSMKMHKIVKSPTKIPTPPLVKDIDLPEVEHLTRFGSEARWEEIQDGR